MTGYNDSHRTETIPTRLAFQPSPEFSETIKHFLLPSLRDYLTRQRRERRIMLFSKNVVHLGLQQNSAYSEVDFVADSKYREMIDQSLNHEFHLQPTFGIALGEESVELQFKLFLNAHDRQRLVAPPLFDLANKDDISIYTRLPRTQMISEKSMHYSIADIRRHLGINSLGESSAVMAPREIFVTEPRVYHRLPQPQIPRAINAASLEDTA